ncbi:aminoacyl-histidine dipeptidase [Erysipelothrix larvae]|uniref:Cytosol non-specific dipeptidase n=1 Tax=Erysipelothrix larvae TaxID=1514105 RepID=A0A0X8GZJ6_9FIRM|nr:beta-Ala-His dipeptidase [Erysipelothrix larvae]AMC93339.1 aminoacyl-histidine dipeptidase [Erysipelothrix larvae]
MAESRIIELFKQISEIPRASFDEERISNFIVDFGLRLGLETIQDEHFNVIIKKQATPGYEDVPTLLLQGHMDMVAEKNKSSNHDFSIDPLSLCVRDGHLWANNTTLGADDGVGVAYMLAILEDTQIHHPALECVFTVQEEVGLIGAENLDMSGLKSELMLGLDSGGENIVCVSSTGGVYSRLIAPIDYEATSYETLQISIRGLLGGHSGIDIDKEYGNALKIAGFILRRALDKFEIRLVDIEGGLKVNAICREVDFEIALNNELIEPFKQWIDSIIDELKFQFQFSDPGLEISISDGQSHRVLSKQSTQKIIDLLFMLPYGVIHKSMAIKDLVIASANIGKIALENNQLEILLSVRATQAFVLDNLMRQVQWITDNLGVQIDVTAHYPGWNYDKDSKLRKQLKDVFFELRGYEIVEEATHGGLELGIFKDKMPALDIVNIGPLMYDIHTPSEHLDLASFERTYEFILAFMKSLNTFNQ